METKAKIKDETPVTAKESKKTSVMMGGLIFGMFAIIVGVIWLICFLTGTGMYAPPPPYTFVNTDDSSVKYILSDVEGNEDYLGFVFDVNISGYKLDRVYYVYSDGENCTEETEINGIKTENEKKEDVIDFNGYIVVDSISKEDLNGKDEYKCVITASDTDGNTQQIGEIIIKAKQVK